MWRRARHKWPRICPVFLASFFPHPLLSSLFFPSVVSFPSAAQSFAFGSARRQVHLPICWFSRCSPMLSQHRVHVFPNSVHDSRAKAANFPAFFLSYAARHGDSHGNSHCDGQQNTDGPSREDGERPAVSDNSRLRCVFGCFLSRLFSARDVAFSNFHGAFSKSAFLSANFSAVGGVSRQRQTGRWEVGFATHLGRNALRSRERFFRRNSGAERRGTEKHAKTSPRKRDRRSGAR